MVAGNIESWYTGPRQEDRNWPALVEILVEAGWDDEAVRDLDESSTKVVAQLPNPHGEGEYHCRGLVLGYVQSGKTTNFTAVIAKAADAGYGFHRAVRHPRRTTTADAGSAERSALGAHIPNSGTA